MEILFRKLNGEFTLCIHTQLKCGSKFEFDTNERKPKWNNNSNNNNKNFVQANFYVEYQF